jgi:SAM-dependent methyltransferase
MIRQCRKPTGLAGRFLLRSMNRRHSGVTAWGLGHVKIGECDTILDVGCGGGRTVQRLAAMASRGRVHGVDYAKTSVAASRKLNLAAIQSGQVEVQQASVSSLPFRDGTFDLVTAVETHYYWPDKIGSMREIFRILKPGGRLLIIAEVYRGRRFSLVYGMAMKIDRRCLPERRRAPRAVYAGRLRGRRGVSGTGQGMDLRDRKQAVVIRSTNAATSLSTARVG